MQTLKFPISCHISTISLNHKIDYGFSSTVSPHIKLPYIVNCKGIEISTQKSSSINSFNFSGHNGVVDGSSFIKNVSLRDADIATLGNLCVDIVLNVPTLPPPSLNERKAYMERLSASRPDKRYWEAGGNCNVAIAAARLGLNCVTIGNVGNEVYGRFLLDVLHNEGIGMVRMNENTDDVVESVFYETLLCWVLVDPLQRHGFCSRADFSSEPAFGWMRVLSKNVKMAIKRSKILFCNGYTFDELSPVLIISVLEYSIEVGTSFFFDPGPRGKTLATGTPEEQRALDQCLRMSDVLLLTSDEAESLTGITNPILAGQELLRKGVRTKWVIVKMGPKGSILIRSSSITCAPTFKVNVIDTVGCGDSFVAAIACGFIHNMPTVYSLALANAVGAATAMGCGAGRNVATLEKVIELVKVSDLNEDESLSNLLDLENIPNLPEIILLSKALMNGINAHMMNHVSLQKVVCELLPKLENVHQNRIISS
ncbi:hypothetical protein C5167_020657 [Papaver somniferum]|uniref:Carbohydrate kinase PfkB domain-containing protein n=1 Tax=Papaver somniferum TaxID=3469 RepID=A0A4Y7IWV2_PAPSO|nr:fructokinase-1-like [Papaver somniferum]RZC52231.1 hypothetical protein C5167_020657 [Papaver somniferum]